MIKKLFWLKIKQTVEFTTNCLLYAMLALLVIVGVKAACLRSVAYETRSPHELTYNLGGVESDSNKVYDYYAYQPPNNPVDSAPFCHVICNSRYLNLNGFEIRGMGYRCAIDIAVQNQQQAATVSITGYGGNVTLYNFGRSGYRQLYRAVIYEEDPEVAYINVQYSGSVSSYPLQITVCGYHILENDTTDLQALNRDRPFTNFWTSPVDQIVYTYDQIQNLIEENQRLLAQVQTVASGVYNIFEDITVTGSIGLYTSVDTSTRENIPISSDHYTATDTGIYIHRSAIAALAQYVLDNTGYSSSLEIESVSFTVKSAQGYPVASFSPYMHDYMSGTNWEASGNLTGMTTNWNYLETGNRYDFVLSPDYYSRVVDPTDTVVNFYKFLWTPIDDSHFGSTVDTSLPIASFRFGTGEFVNSVTLATAVSVFSDDDTFAYGFGYYGYDNFSYQQGYAEGFRSAANTTYEVAYERGYNDSQRSKIAYGESRYNQGITDALNHTDAYGFTGLFGAVTQVPVNIFRAIFNFEILGTNIASFLFTIVTIIVVIAVVKFLFL